MKLVAFTTVLERAVEDGFLAAALFDRDGDTIGIAGEISDDEARPLAALVMHRLQSADMPERLFAGEILLLRLDERDVAVAVAKRQLFLVVTLESATVAVLTEVRDLLKTVEDMLPADEPDLLPPWRTSGGGSGSGPAELPLIELGITVGRARAKN